MRRLPRRLRLAGSVHQVRRGSQPHGPAGGVGPAADARVRARAPLARGAAREQLLGPLVVAAVGALALVAAVHAGLEALAVLLQARALLAVAALHVHEVGAGPGRAALDLVLERQRGYTIIQAKPCKIALALVSGRPFRYTNIYKFSCDAVVFQLYNLPRTL